MINSKDMRLCALGILACLFVCVAHVGTMAAPQRGLSLTVREAGAEQTIPLYQRSYALVIGNDKYDDPAWVDLSNAINDAKAVAMELENRGFEVTLLENLNSRDLKQQMEEFFILKGEDPNTRLLVWYAGHGHTIGNEGYLVPVDAPDPEGNRVGRFRLKSLALRRFGEFMRQSNARHVLAVFDSCFSGTVFSTARSKPPSVVNRAVALKVRQFVSSGDANQTVGDDGQFRKLFLDAISGRDPRADANGDGYVLGTELGLFLNQRMSNLTDNKQIPRSGKINAYELDLGDFVFQTEQAGQKTTRKAVKPPSDGTPSGNEDLNARIAKLEAMLKGQLEKNTQPKPKPSPLRLTPKDTNRKSESAQKKWSTYHLGEVAVDVPVDWKVASRSRNRQYSFKSPDNAHQLTIFWWFPDEPILGFSDIVSHKKITVAGKTATWVHSKFPQNQSVQVVFDEARADKRQFIMLMDFGLDAFAANTKYLDQILARVSYGKEVVSQKTQQKIASLNPDNIPASSSNRVQTLNDPKGGFSINHPSDWQTSFADRDGMRIVTLKPKNKSAMVLVVSKQAGANQTLEKIFHDYETIFFSDSFLPNSIDGDDDVTVGNVTARLFESSGEIYAVEGVRLPFSMGKLKKYAIKSGNRAYEMLVLFPDNAASDLLSKLDAIVSSFRSGDARSASLQETGRTKPQGQGSKDLQGQEDAKLARRFGADCKRLDMSNWRHPTRQLMESRSKVHLKWAMLCQNNVYPLFGVEFDLDPQGQTNHFFYPLYLEMLDANGMWPFSFVVSSDQLIINLASDQQTGLSVDIQKLK